VAFSVPFWLASRWNARQARELSDQARLLAARIRAEEAKKVAEGMEDLPQRREDEDPEMIFHVVRGDDLIEVEVYLDKKMLGELSHGEPAAWQGLIEFVEDDIDQLP
jgi:hypothetical protein